MSKYIELLKKVAKNKVLHYVVSRYATFLIQFVNSLFIAVYLGPYYLGIWGFITLVIQFLNQINLGITHSVNAIISIHKNKEWYVQKVVGTSFTMLLGLSLIVILLLVINIVFNLNLGGKYDFSSYGFSVVLISILGYFNSLFSNVFRVYGRIVEIAINQSAFPLLMLVAIFIFKGEDLLHALVGANLIAFLISFILYLFKSPVTLRLLWIGRLIKTIQVKGWYLFVYNTSFYMIIISTKTFISSYYSVEEFGYFTFAFALGNVILLFLQSLSFLITPKLFNRLASASTEKAASILEMVRNSYITTSHLLIHLAILLFPLFLMFFPQYNQSLVVFKLIALTVVLYTNSFGYSGLLIAKGYEKKLGQLSFLALLINILLALVLIKVFYVPFTYVIIATMVTYFIYVFLLGRIGRRKLKFKSNVLSVLKDIYPIRLIIPYLISLCLIIFSAPNFYFGLPFILFLLLNYEALKEIKPLIKEVFLKPEFIDI